MIIRGTTPYHSFILPILAEEIDTIWITYCQNEDIIFERSNTVEDDRMDITNLVDLYENASVEELTDEEKQWSQLTLHLTQEETLGFHFYPAAKKNIATISIRILATDQEAYASEPILERIFGIRHDGVIGNEESDNDIEQHG
jgi:hypothetical protein